MSEGFGTPVSGEWVNIQKRTFTRWCNKYLSIRQLKIEDLESAFEDGIVLIALLELISNKELPKHNKSPRIRAQKLENVQTALKFVQSEGIKLVNIGSEDFVDKKLTLILGFVWTLILRYHIQKGGVSTSAKNDLLRWVQSKIPHKNVTNFTNSWNDGTALCELAEVLKPGQLDPRQLNPANRLDNAVLGVTSAEKNMDIPPVLAPEDMVADEPDELSVMTYISYFRDYDRRMNAARDEEEKRRTSVPEQCVAHGPGLEGGETFKTGKFRIEARNCYGELVNHGNDQFVVLIKSPKNHAVEVQQTNNGNGTYDCVYVPDTAGVHTISITLHNKAIKHSPWRPNITRAEADAGTSSVEGPGIEPGNEAGKPTHFKIIAREKSGNQLTVGGDPFKVKITGPWGEVANQFKDNNDGTYVCNYTPLSPGKYTVEVTLNGKQVDKSTYHIDVERPANEADAQFCEAHGSGLENGIKSAYQTNFTITAKNKAGDFLSIDPHKHFFSVEVLSPPAESKIASTISGNADGTLNVTYTPLRPGEYQIHVVLHDPREPLFYDHIKGSIFKVTIKASADAGQSEAYGPGLQDGIKDTEQTHFTVLAKDIDGNKILNGGDDIGCKIVGPKGENIPFDLKDNNDGTYTVTYQPAGPGKHVITPTVQGKPVKKAPFTVNVNAGADAGHSFIEGYTFRIRAVDARGDNRKDGGDVFKVEIHGPSGPVQGIKVDDNKDGSYLVSYKLPGSGDYQVETTINGQHIKGSPWKQTA